MSAAIFPGVSGVRTRPLTERARAAADRRGQWFRLLYRLGQHWPRGTVNQAAMIDAEMLRGIRGV